MTTIQVTALRQAGGPGGPEVPSAHAAHLVHRPWPGEGTVRVLRLYLGDAIVEVWPADPEAVSKLGEKLLQLGQQLHAEQLARECTG